VPERSQTVRQTAKDDHVSAVGHDGARPLEVFGNRMT
jgi:hypothetical protein